MSIVLLFGFLASFAYLAIFVLVIVNIIKNDSIDNNNKLFWIAMILFFNVLGLIVYLIVGDKNVLK